MGKWRALLGLAVVCLGFSSAGCFVNEYPGDNNDRLDVLYVQSENLRQVYGEWRRFWMTDQPSHMTYDRVDGGITPR